ncbi:hypothetical protein K501DRAFT_296655 [Backusella circina FSU 941]|nr:hypothetical protein K501DRAFT_296655 [Backusella circina FSU 941]
MIWTPNKYRPSQVAQFISLMQNENYKLAKAAKETGIAYDAAYKFNNNRNLYVEDYVEAHPACIVKDIMEQLSAKFGDLPVNDSTVYRHITKKIGLATLKIQRNRRKHFVEYLCDNNMDFKRKCVFIDESGFKKNMIALSQQVPKPNVGTKRGLSHGTNSSHFLLFIEEME